MSNSAFSKSSLNTPLTPQNGGTGVSNDSGNTQTFSGAYGITYTLTATTSVTLPTSGTLAALGGANTWTGVQQFGTIGGTVGKLVLAGSTSGSSILNAAAVAGTTTMTLPTTTGTLVGTGDTGSVTNAMLAGSIAASKLVGSDIATVGTITSGTWSGTTIAVAKGGTGDTGTAWSAFTPTVTAGTGSITAYTATGREKTIGKTVFVEMTITLTTIGTAGASIIATLNTGAGTPKYILNGRETNATGFLLSCDIGSNSASTIQIRKYDNTFLGANGYVMVITGVYEAA